MTRYFLILTLFSSLHLFAQSCPEGSKEFRAQAYEQALEAYSRCLEEHPTDSMVVFMNGYLHLVLKEYAEAIPLLEKSIELQFAPKRNAQFAIARSYAGLNDLDKSLAYLDEAIKGGFASFPRLDSAEFDPFRDDVKFIAMKEQMEMNAFPCMKDDNNARFDFWVGEWDVFVGSTKRADSKITKAKGGCAILEDYKVLSGAYSGQSISYYDDADKIWNQYWVGSGGDKSRYYETSDYAQEADMQFMTKSTNAQGVEIWTKMSYLQQDENTVLQNLDSSSDGGKTWNAGFRGVYKRKTK